MAEIWLEQGMCRYFFGDFFFGDARKVGVGARGGDAQGKEPVCKWVHVSGLKRNMANCGCNGGKMG
jgi:hypothetical protein